MQMKLKKISLKSLRSVGEAAALARGSANVCQQNHGLGTKAKV